MEGTAPSVPLSFGIPVQLGIDGAMLSIPFATFPLIHLRPAQFATASCGSDGFKPPVKRIANPPPWA